ncbi:hypothetical protein Leryth_018974 [Lithospermum erythrorhizon]|nr:hypothetical protein Leryth_018974 [Lithospermum erythrorhizon]
MEGLIPLIINAIKKQRPRQSYRYLSQGSSRSYHLLLSADSSVSDSTQPGRTSHSVLPQPPTATSATVHLSSPPSHANGGLSYRTTAAN